MERLIVSTLTSVVLMGSPQISANTLTIVPDGDLANLTSVSMMGTDNLLQIVQTSGTSLGEANRITVSIDGDRNGVGRLPSWMSSGEFGGGSLDEALSGGRIVQSGDANLVSFSISGSDNLFSLVQVGSSNSITGEISGVGNVAAVQQFGEGNISAFSQNGNGNIVSISQTSW